LFAITRQRADFRYRLNAEPPLSRAMISAIKHIVIEHPEEESPFPHHQGCYFSIKIQKSQHHVEKMRSGHPSSLTLTFLELISHTTN